MGGSGNMEYQVGLVWDVLGLIAPLSTSEVGLLNGNQVEILNERIAFYFPKSHICVDHTTYITPKSVPKPHPSP